MGTLHAQAHILSACSDRCKDASCVVNDQSPLSPPATYPQHFHVLLLAEEKLIFSSLHTGGCVDYGLCVHFPLADCRIVTWMEQFNRSLFRSTTYCQSDYHKKERMWMWMLIRDLKRKHSKSTDQIGQHATVSVFLKSNEVRISQLSVVCHKWKAS